MLIGIMRHIWNAAQVLPDELSENSVALAVKDSNSWHTYQDGIVNEILNGIQCLIATHTSYIQILMEIGLVGINRLAGLLADTIRSQVFLALFGLIYVFGCGCGVLQSVEAHLGTHAAKNSSGSIAVDALYLSYCS